MSKSHWLVIIALSIIIGIGLGLVIHIWPPLLWSITGLSCISTAIAVIKKSRPAAVASIIILTATLGIFRASKAVEYNSLANSYGEKIDTHGIITEEPDIREGKQLLTITLEQPQSKVLVTVGDYTHYAYGDLVWVRGKLAEPKNSETFNYQKFLARDNIYALLYYPKIITLKQNSGNRAVHVIVSFKQMLIRRLQKTVPQPENGLLLGILLGTKQALNQTIISDFSATGISHVIAVSGFNISILVIALQYLSPLIGRRWNFILSCAVIIIFTIMTGASASVIRAAIMGLLLLISFQLGRLYAIGTALVVTAAFMVIWSPLIILWDVGFQLSFLATIGIVYGVPLFENIADEPSSLLGIKSALLATLAANIATMPLLLYQFGKISIIAPLVNIIVLPLVPISMLAGSLSLLPVIGYGFGFLTTGILWLMITIAHIGSSIPYAQVEYRISGWMMGVMWGVIGVAYLYVRYRKNNVKIKM